MSLTPAQDEIEAKRKKELIELCGRNRGTHDYIPIEWFEEPNLESGIKYKRVTRLICRNCFANVSIKTLLENYPDVSV